MKNRVLRAWRALKRNVLNAAGILSDRSNPAEDPGMAEGFRKETKWMTFVSLVFGLQVFILCCSPGGKVLDAVFALCGALVAVLSFKTAMVIKSAEWQKKVAALTGGYVDPYEAAVLKLAVAYPGLPPPTRKSYGRAKAKAEKNRRLREAFATNGVPSRVLSRIFSTPTDYELKP